LDQVYQRRFFEIVDFLPEMIRVFKLKKFKTRGKFREMIVELYLLLLFHKKEEKERDFGITS